MASDESIMQEAIRLVGEGVSVTFPVNGRSMLPFIVGGEDSVVLVKPETLKVGDVVLAQVEGDSRLSSMRTEVPLPMERLIRISSFRLEW